MKAPTRRPDNTPITQRSAFAQLDALLNEPATTPSSDISSDTAFQSAVPQAFRAVLDTADQQLHDDFNHGIDIRQLINTRAAIIDGLILRAWTLCLGAATNTALAAVGGYGRSELHPESDIDLLILVEEPPAPPLTTQLAKFLTLLWDIGLQVGHSVRTVAECVTTAHDNITVATNLMEARLLTGNANLFQQMEQRTAPPHTWPIAHFFTEKWQEQRNRHAHYHDTAYKLEPNIKESPGGLRDIQMIGWIAQRYFGTGSLKELVTRDFLTGTEYQLLAQGEQFLWRIRFTLHKITGRREDRLLFDYQRQVAQQFGYIDKPGRLGVEQFMQDYYRTVMELSCLNEMLLELFEAAILQQDDTAIKSINNHFQARAGLLEVTSDNVFGDNPSAMLELFLVLEQHPALKGVSPDTLRLLRKHRHLIDDSFRANAENRALFMAILREPQGVTHELRRMNRYGILGRYLPAFGAIIGRMQYDLFHTYTVDEHTLFVVSHLRRFALPRFDHEFPLCSSIMQALSKPELAYLAGLFHDIAKGRGGNHSELGAADAEQFCLNHGLSRYDARLVSWLVEHHLSFSTAAQKKDITDPRIINEFAGLVGDQTHLDYLYVLTIADVRATNPALWNSWKASLFRELYDMTKRALNQGLENPIDAEDLIDDTQQAALELLRAHNINRETASAVWQALPAVYFLRHTPDEIAWHTELLSDNIQDTIRVAVRQQTDRGGTAVLLYAPQDDSLFARASAVLDQLGLTVLDARIISSSDHNSLLTYLVLEDTGTAIEEPSRLEEIRQVLLEDIQQGANTPMRVTRRIPRQVRLFDSSPVIHFYTDPQNNRTILELQATDRPGLLSAIGQIFNLAGVRLHNAKITTLGARAEDVFYLTDRYNNPLTDTVCDEMKDDLLRHALKQ
ncbi:MAG TPA: [protein-PII] uridylyltransferase [Gammaproteobacteria bacterium]|nr:[protein-PII] uridylyltransferase [Gammaproteobacteria bacterium]